jgi:nitrogen regulatory protein P-II 1
MNNKLIVIIIKKGLASKLLDVAKKHGAEGGTITYGKGSAESHIYEKILGIKYEIEKEIILMAVNAEKTNNILNNIITKFKLNTPGKGIAFVIDIKKCLGIVHLLNKEGEIK